jgi:hypothetical protein
VIDGAWFLEAMDVILEAIVNISLVLDEGWGGQQVF